MPLTKSSFSKLARGLVPSTAMLSYNPVFRFVGNALTRLPDLVFPEFRQLPPNHLRVRVGVGNQLLNNQAYHLIMAENLWFDWLANGYCSATADIVEIGCGCGRVAQHLDAPWFKGTYLGIDIDEELIAWDRKRFAAPKFRFELSRQRSQTYGNAVKHTATQSNGKAAATGMFSFGDEPQKDFVYATSLLTHLLEPETRNYLSEVARILRPGGIMYMTFFSMQHVTLGGRWTFRHRAGNAYIENPRVPEAAVAYDDKFLTDLALQAGLADVRVVPSEGQSGLFARK